MNSPREMVMPWTEMVAVEKVRRDAFPTYFEGVENRVCYWV